METGMSCWYFDVKCFVQRHWKYFLTERYPCCFHSDPKNIPEMLRQISYLPSIAWLSKRFCTIYHFRITFTVWVLRENTKYAQYAGFSMSLHMTRFLANPECRVENHRFTVPNFISVDGKLEREYLEFSGVPAAWQAFYCHSWLSKSMKDKSNAFAFIIILTCTSSNTCIFDYAQSKSKVM